MNKIAQNFFYQVIFQTTKIIIPIITIPFVSQAIGPKGLGMYNYTFSIAQYFVIFASLGVDIYGNREISITKKKNEVELSKVFWEIFLFKFIITLVVLFFYFIFISFLPERSFFYAQSLIIVSVLFDISWLFMGLQDFKKTSMINLFVQILTFISVLTFVKNESDAITYTIIQSVGILTSQILVWIHVKQYIKFEKVNINNCFKHFRRSFEFFIPQVAITFYTNVNKTILGFFLGSVAVGYYSNATQLSRVFVTIITTLDIVLLPYMSGLFAKNNTQRIINTMKLTIDAQFYISIPICFGILTVYDKLVPWFFGESFIYITKIIPFFSILVIIVPLGMSISRQYLLPIGKIRDYNKSVLLGAIINILLNILLLPKIGFMGVVIANLSAELFVTVARLKAFLETTSFKFDLIRIFKYTISALLMMLISRYLTKDMSATISTNILQICIAVPVYLILTSSFKANPIIDLMKRKKKKEKI